MTSLTTFHLFPSLPFDIRFICWELAIPRRHLYVFPNNNDLPLLTTCKESRAIVLPKYTRFNYPHTEQGSGSFLINFDTDVIFAPILGHIKQAADVTDVRRPKKLLVKVNLWHIRKLIDGILTKVLPKEPQLEELVVVLFFAWPNCTPEDKASLMQVVKSRIAPVLKKLLAQREVRVGRKQFRVLIDMELQRMKMYTRSGVFLSGDGEVELDDVVGDDAEELHSMWRGRIWHTRLDNNRRMLPEDY